jgi:hypothetical protein
MRARRELLPFLLIQHGNLLRIVPREVFAAA